MLFEPATVDGFLALPLLAAEAAQHHRAIHNQTGVGGEDQIGQVFARRHQAHLRAAFDDVLESRPLIERPNAVGEGVLALHPGIDDIGHLEMIGRTHQNAVHRVSHLDRRSDAGLLKIQRLRSSFVPPHRMLDFTVSISCFSVKGLGRKPKSSPSGRFLREGVLGIAGNENDLGIRRRACAIRRTWSGRPFPA